jgi:hypothetical protein
MLIPVAVLVMVFGTAFAATARNEVKEPSHVVVSSTVDVQKYAAREQEPAEISKISPIAAPTINTIESVEIPQEKEKAGAAVGLPLARVKAIEETRKLFFYPEFDAQKDAEE